MIFVGDDWSEDHHDVEVQDETGRRLVRQRGADARAGEIQAALRGEHLEPPAVLAEMNRQLAPLELQLADHFERHPDAEIIRSQPGLGVVVGARVLGEFGDDPTRYADAKSRRNYAGTAPITIASGKKKVIKARLRLG